MMGSGSPSLATEFAARRNDARENSEASQLLTADQLADRWQIKPATVYALTRNGSIPTVKLGRLYRYRLAAVEAWEAAGGGETHA